MSNGISFPLDEMQFYQIDKEIGAVIFGDRYEVKKKVQLWRAAPKLYELAEAVAKLPDEQCMINPLIHEARKLITSINEKEAEHE